MNALDQLTQQLFSPQNLDKLNSILTYTELKRKPLVQHFAGITTGGSVTFTHNLGVIPNTVVLEPATDGDNTWISSKTATTVTVTTLHANKNVAVTLMYLPDNFK
jgi:hypothetical protein